MAGKVVPMTSGSIWKHITFFALPIMLGNLFQQLYTTVDSVIVGNFLGSSALAAVSSSGSLTYTLIGLLMGVASGAGVLVAQYFGAGNEAALHRVVHTTVAFGLTAGAVLTAVGVAMTPLFLTWMGTPEGVMPEATVYLRVYFAGAVGLVMYNIFVGILQAVGDSRHPLIYLIVCSVVNLVLDLLFIGVFHTGVGGAALATILSQVFSAGLCLLRLTRTRDSYRICFRDVGFDREMLKSIIRIGLPAGVQNSIISFSNVVIQSHINSFGQLAMAGCGAYDRISGFSFLPINSFTLALSTFVGQNLGAGSRERVQKGARFGILVTVILSELIGVIIYLASPWLMAAFNSDPAVIAYGVRQAHIAAPAYCLLAFSYCIASILRGSGRSMTPMLVMILCWCAVRVAGLSVLIPLTRDIRLLYFIYPFTWALSSVVFALLYRKSDWLDSALARHL